MLLTFDGGTGAEPAGLTPVDLAALIRLLRGCCGHVVLNAGSLRHGGLLREVMAEADRMELLCGQSIREIEACRRLLDRIGTERERIEAMRLLVWDHLPGVLLDGRRMADALGVGAALALRSEEHTFELLSLMRNSYAVFGLKKNNNISKQRINDM